MEKRVQCCIAGGGPAGLMLGVLLARVGVKVLVLEKHADFLRDFRGDTVHPSTLEVMHELGWLDELLTLPHQKVPNLVAQFGETRIRLADFSHLPVKAPFIAMMPQWDFLDFLARKGRVYPSFALEMNAEARELIVEGERVTGLGAQTKNGPLTVHADLIVAADGRSSTMRKAAGFKAEEFGAPMDALWFRLPRHATDTDQTQGRFEGGRIFVMLNRGDYWQCAFVIPKGGDAKVRAAGLEAFRASVAPLLPFAPARAGGIKDLDDVKLLVVQVDRLKEWARLGFLCIGDAAHAMSPVGGVGINLAIQDAVAAANILAVPMRESKLTFQDVQRVQMRRDFPTRMTQNLQLTMQNTIIATALAAKGPVKPPLALRIIAATPGLNRLPARLLGLGVRREHVAPFIREVRG
jgi:2-polyprenyl-6-methoxyphenol hydroxylase-like FAD-dependent oxidoreductase